MKMRINPSVQLGVSFLLSMVILFTKSWKLNEAMMLASIVIIVLFRQQPWRRCKTRTGVTDDYLDVFSVSLFLSK